MSPKKSKTTKPALKKTGTMTATATTGQEYLKRTWGETRLNRVNAYLDARHKQDVTSKNETSSSTTKIKKTKIVKPKLLKTRTMQNTAQEAKLLLGEEILADTRTETKRRQAIANAKKILEKAKKPKRGRKPTVKRLGTMVKTANEGKAYIKRTGRKRTSGRNKNSTK